MKIHKIYVNTFRYDLNFTQLCLASIRYWYPEIPICLIIDYSKGNLPYLESLCIKWNVSVFPNNGASYGWGFGKFEPLLLPNEPTFLMLDSDTILVGPLLKSLEEIEADFIVDKEVQNKKDLSRLYYDLKQLEIKFPFFKYPNYSFNSGQWVGKGGFFTLTELQSYIFWERGVPKLRNPEIFKQADQGLFNFLLQNKKQNKELSIHRKKIMFWPGEVGLPNINKDNIVNKFAMNFPSIVHYAGFSTKRNQKLPFQDILDFYQQSFQSKLTNKEYYQDFLVKYWLEVEKWISYKLR